SFTLPAGKVRLNIGSGPEKLDGYINIDCLASFNPDIPANALNLRVGSSSVDEIYASHLIEHLQPEETQLLLRRFHNWLKGDGKLFIAVPDMIMLAKLFVDGIDALSLMQFVFGQPILAYPEQRHQWGYTEKTLTAHLEAAGFKVLGRFNSDHNDSSCCYVGDSLISLNLLCEK
ncbi:hypothetical protein LCGC14_2024400, partial [marine sediment metagenome]